jgi:hypothetical protein
MIMGITTNSFTPGSSSNSADVTLTNTGASPVTIGGFSFEITSTSNDVTFSDVTVSTVSVPYIFNGNSYFGPDITLNITNSGLTISAADNYGTSSAGITLTQNETLGLGNVVFALAAGTPLTPIPVNFTAYPTSSLSYPTSGGPTVGFSSNPALNPSSVPELPPAALVVIGVFAGAVIKLRRHGLAGLLLQMRPGCK